MTQKIKFPLFSGDKAKVKEIDNATENTQDSVATVIVKPSFEHGYITMDDDGLAIAMIPRQA